MFALVMLLISYSHIVDQKNLHEISRIYHYFVQGQRNPPECQNLWYKMRLAKSWTLHIFDTRVDFPVPVERDG